MARFIDADKLDFTKIFIGQTNLAKDAREIAKRYIDSQPTAFDVDKVVEQMEEKTNFLSECTKYGNKCKEQQKTSYETMMNYEIADMVDDLIDIVKRGGIDES